jgi:hypothetical protein
MRPKTFEESAVSAAKRAWARLAFRDRTLEAKPWVSLTALEISFDNPVLHRNLSGSFEDGVRAEALGYSL